MLENEGHGSEGVLRLEIPDVTEFQRQLPYLEQDLLLTDKRELASQTIRSFALSKIANQLKAI